MSTDKKTMRYIALGTSIGSGLAGSVLLGIFLGSYLDRWLGTKPWFFLSCTLLGLAMGVYSVIHIIKMLEKTDSE
ncbi:MAG TPA: AtpZ/AtpI family protein [Candidatus Deferrimicrobium sp.]|nr:AtpZ/AtpI family protein [Candidatus Deferrimicrobium sp.]